MTSLGGLYDGRFYSLYLEPSRIVVHLTLLQLFPILSNDVIANAAIGIDVFSLFLFPAVAKNIRDRVIEEYGTKWSEEKERKVGEGRVVTNPILQNGDNETPFKLKSH